MAFTRRNFLAASGWAWLAGMSASTATSASPLRTPSFVVSTFGARGDGATDDTDAFQRAIDAAGNRGGGVVTVPPGRYLLDPLRSVRLRSGVQLQMDADCTLVARPNAAEHSVLILVERVEDVTISGGRVLGERDRHMGTTGEWGHGIQLRGASRVTLRDIHVANFWGDGVSVAGAKPVRGESAPLQSSDVLVERIVSIGNRRQGLTIGGAKRVRVFDCEFAGTRGTAPEAGIDVEPDTTAAVDIEIARCRIHDNNGPGIQVWKRGHHVRIHDCTLEGNRYGVLVMGAEDTTITGNRIAGSAYSGIVVRKANGAAIDGNRFADNARRTGLLERLRPHGGGVPPSHLRIEPDARGVRVGSGNRYD